MKDLYPEVCKQKYTGYTSSEERQWLEISKQTVRVESRGRETSVPGVKSFYPVSSTIPDNFSLDPSQIIFPPFWEVTVLQNVAEIIHWVGTKVVLGRCVYKDRPGSLHPSLRSFSMVCC